MILNLQLYGQKPEKITTTITATAAAASSSGQQQNVGKYMRTKAAATMLGEHER